MYNLIMVGREGYWDESPQTLSRNRIFEYTPKAITEKFERLEPPSVDELLALPCLFAYERAAECDAHVGAIRGFRQRDGEVRIDFEFDPAFPPVPHGRISDLVWELDIGEWELNRTHWAVKDVDLLEELMKAGLFSEVQIQKSFFAAKPARDANDEIQIHVSPTVFKVPAGGVEGDLVAVMRPFKAEFTPVQQKLEETCNALGLRCLDVNQVWNESEIIQDIFSLIYHARAVICDFSERNPNVFYEAGIAHTLGKPVIPIVQDGDHIPFDLKHHRYVEYESTKDGLDELSKKVGHRLASLFEL